MSNIWKRLWEYYQTINVKIYHGFKYAFTPLILAGVLWCMTQNSPSISPLAKAMDSVEIQEATLYAENGVVNYRASNSRAMPMMATMKLESSVSNDTITDKIIINGGVKIEVKNLETAKQQIETLVQNYQGKIRNYYSYYLNNNNLAYNFSLRIPSGSLNDFMREIEGLGIKKSENMNITDITETYYDNENKLKNLTLRRDRLRQLLSTNTKKLSDIIEVERELSNVQTQLENLQRTQLHNDNDVAYASFNVELIPEIVINTNENHWSFSQSVKKAINFLISFGQRTIEVILMFMVFILVFLPTLIICSLIAWLIYRVGSFVVRYISHKHYGNDGTSVQK